jgi:hypothetical protein
LFFRRGAFLLGKERIGATGIPADGVCIWVPGKG